jgi:hypothetical protein
LRGERDGRDGEPPALRPPAGRREAPASRHEPGSHPQTGYAPLAKGRSTPQAKFMLLSDAFRAPERAIDDHTDFSVNRVEKSF